MDKHYYVYLLTNKTHSVLYIGMTNDLLRRIYEHKNKLIKGFTEKYKITLLVYFEEYRDPLTAIQREKSLKNLVRRKKIEFIEKANPTWKDLYEEILSSR